MKRRILSIVMSVIVLVNTYAVSVSAEDVDLEVDYINIVDSAIGFSLEKPDIVPDALVGHLLAETVDEGANISFDEYEKKYTEINAYYKEKYGISYEDFFNTYASYLNQDNMILAEIYNKTDKVEESLSGKDTFIAAFLHNFGSIDKPLDEALRAAFPIVSTPYEQLLDEATLDYVQLVMENEKQLTAIVKKVNDKYASVKNIYSAVDGIHKMEFVESVAEKYSVLSKSEVEALRNKILANEEDIKVSLGDAMSVTEYFLLTLEISEIDIELLDMLIEAQPRNTALKEGLQRLKEDKMGGMTVDAMLERFYDKKILGFMSEQFKNFFSGCETRNGYFTGDMNAAFAFCKVVIGYAKKQYSGPSATDITKYYIFKSFVDSSFSAETNKVLKMTNKINEGKKITRQDIEEYEILYNAQLKALDFYIDYSIKVLGNSDAELKNTLTNWKKLLNKDFGYTEHIELCMQCKGKEIGLDSLNVSSIWYTVEKGQTLQILGGDSNKCRIVNSNGDVIKTLFVLNGKEIGGISLEGGTIEVLDNARISKLVVPSGGTGGEIIVASDKVLQTDAFVSNDSRVYLSGSIKSLEPVIITSSLNYTSDNEKNSKFNGTIISDTMDIWNARYLNNITLEANELGSTYEVTLRGNCQITGKWTCAYLYIGSDGNVVFNDDITVGYKLGVYGKAEFKKSLTQNERCRLLMDAADPHLIVYGDYNMNGYMANPSGGDFYVTKGIVELKGNVKGTIHSDWLYKTYPIYVSEDAKLVLSGESPQHIDSYIIAENFECLNENVYFGGMEIGNLLSDVTMLSLGSLEIENGNGYTISLNNAPNTYPIKIKNGNLNANINTEFNRPIELENGNLEIACNYKGSLNLKNVTGSINGDTYVTDMVLDNSKLDIIGNLECTNKFSMLGETTYLLIDKNFNMMGYTCVTSEDYSVSDQYYVTDGTLELKGDFYNKGCVKSTYNMSLEYTYYSTFYAYNNFKLLLSGENQHFICESKIKVPSMESVNPIIIDAASSSLVLDTLETDIDVAGGAGYFTITDGNGKYIRLSPKFTGEVNISNGNVVSDEIINANVILNNSHLVATVGINSTKLQMTANSVADISGGNVNVSSLNVTDSIANIEKSLQVGSFQVMNGVVNIIGDCEYNTYIAMDGENSYVTVNGDLRANGYSYYYNWGSDIHERISLEDGVLEVNGDIIAKDNRNYNNIYYRSFCSKNNFKLVLNGNQQTINIPANNKIANLEQGENSICSVSENIYIGNLNSDFRLNNASSFTIDNWNNHCVTDYNCTNEYNIKYPVTYETETIPQEDMLYTVIYKPIELSNPYSNMDAALEIDKGTEIILSTDDKNCVIYYTLDGTDPTTNSQRYEKPIIVTSDTIIKFVSSKKEVLSDIITREYKIKTYSINTQKDLPAGILVVNTEAKEGDTVDIILNAVEGYSVNVDLLRVVSDNTEIDLLENDEGKIYFIMPRNNVTIELQCEAKTYDISYNYNGGGATEVTNEYTYYQTYTLPIPVKEDFVFEGWYDNEELDGRLIYSIEAGTTGNKEYWAKWSPVVTDWILDKTVLELHQGENANIARTISEDENLDIIWESSDTNVAMVDEYGNVTAIASGLAVITVKALDGSEKYASCTVVITKVKGQVVCGQVESFSASSDTSQTVDIKLYNSNDVSMNNAIYEVESTDGTYEIDDVEAGAYIMSVSKENHVTRCYNITVSDSDVYQDVIICLKGDVTGDGKVNSQDLNTVRNHINYVTQITDEYKFRCADVTGDGRINSQDLNAIRNHINYVDRFW